MKPSGHEELK